jgi:hypothetical protein
MAEQILTVGWRKSTYSGNGVDCVEVGAWRKSTYSGNGGEACVEVASSDAVLVRDTTNRGGITLSIHTSAWSAFLATL